MANGFDEFADEIEEVANAFYRASEDTVSQGRDPESGQFITVKDAIQGGVTAAMREEILPEMRRVASEEYLPAGERPRISSGPKDWTGDRLNYSFGSRNELVGYHEFGTGRHGRGNGSYTIEPTDADVLSFYWERIGERVAFEYVVHPGVEDKHLLEDVLKTHVADIRGEIIERLNK